MDAPSEPSPPGHRAALALALALLTVPAASGAAATYAHDVAPLLETHCVACHRANSSARSMPLTDYASARASGAALLTAVESGAMPPWPIDAAHSAPMANDPRLSPAEVAVLRQWLAAGMPRGSVAPEKRAHPGSDGWNHPTGRAPDAIITMPSIPVPATGEIPYLRVLIPVSITEDRWIGALQALPGDPAAVHHMGIAEVRLPDGVGPDQVRELQEVAAKMGMPARSLVVEEPAVVDHDLSGDYDMLAAFTPGEGFEALPEGTGKLLRAGKNYYINFNVHYTTTGRATTDQSRLGLWFLRTPPGRQVFRTPSPGRTLLADGHPLYAEDTGSKAEGTNVAIPPIPPYADNYELVGITAYDRPVTLYSFQPHAHLRGKDFRYDLVTPDGRTRTLLSIPKYDYHWQLSYTLATPVEAPAGSKLVVTAHYDNSASNTHLRDYALTDPSARCGPDKYAFFRSQNQTWDEMFSPIVQYALRPGVPEAERLATVSARGCLVRAGGTRWQLVHASASRPTPDPAIHRSELGDAGGEAGGEAGGDAGDAAYGLIGTDPFRPGPLEGRRVLAKGVRIPGWPHETINVTALQATGGSCDP